MTSKMARSFLEATFPRKKWEIEEWISFAETDNLDESDVEKAFKEWLKK